jgi:hypothetical protein
MQAQALEICTEARHRNLLGSVRRQFFVRVKGYLPRVKRIVGLLKFRVEMAVDKPTD